MEHCHYTTLHHCDHGYVVHCRNCDSYQLAFGNVTLHLLLPEYEALWKFICVQYEKKELHEERHCKNIYLPTDSRKVSMVLSAEEIACLYDMLQKARIMSQLFEIIYHKN